MGARNSSRKIQEADGAEQSQISKGHFSLRGAAEQDATRWTSEGSLSVCLFVASGVRLAVFIASRRAARADERHTDGDAAPPGELIFRRAHTTTTLGSHSELATSPVIDFREQRGKVRNYAELFREMQRPNKQIDCVDKR